MTITTRFDRTSPEPPPYLDVLRCRGGRRHYKAVLRGTKFYSEALKQAYGQRLPKRRRLFIDAGCGHSPDAAMAVKYLGFKSAIKIDLFDLWPDNPYWAKDEKQLGGNQVEFIKGDICKLTDYVPPNSADLICCNAVVDLMSFADRHLFYHEALEVLAQDGILIVSHIPLAAGYQDWTHAYDEFEPLEGTSDAWWIHGSKSLLVIQKDAVSAEDLALAIPATYNAENSLAEGGSK